MTKISDLKLEDIYVGLRVKSLKNRFGTIAVINYYRDDTTWIVWDGDNEVSSGFNWNQCECEVADYPTKSSSVIISFTNWCEEKIMNILQLFAEDIKFLPDGNHGKNILIPRKLSEMLKERGFLFEEILPEYQAMKEIRSKK